jgi:hypothetical protein
MEELSCRHDAARKQPTRSETKAHSLRKEDLVVLRRKTQHRNEKRTSYRTSNGNIFRVIRIDDSAKKCAASPPAAYDNVSG